MLPRKLRGARTQRGGGGDEIDGALEPAKQETDGIAIHGRHHLDGFHGKPRRKEPTLQSSDDGG